MMRTVFGPDPLDDPLVLAWDAIVQNDQYGPSEVDPADVALMRHVHTMDEPATLSSTFFQDLEERLAGISPMPVDPRWWSSSLVAPTIAAAPPEKGYRRSPNSTAGQSQTHPRSIQWPGGRHSLQGALAVVAVLMVVGLLVLYQVVPNTSEPPPIPAAVIDRPEIEPITQFEFAPPIWELSEATAWNHMEIGMFSVAPATSFTTDIPWYTSGDGPLLLTVLSGELTVTPVGSALLYTANQSSHAPEEVSAGKSVAIGPNDTLAFSAKETAIGNNSGSQPALVLYALVGAMEHHNWSSIRPADVSFMFDEYINPMSSVPTEGAVLKLQRLELAPFDTFVFEQGSAPRYVLLIHPVSTTNLRIVEGVLEGLAPDSGTRGIYGGAQLRYFKPGTYTIFNVGDETVSFYFLVIEPLPAEGTPAA